MPWDEIKAVGYTKWHINYNMSKIVKRSSMRVNKLKTFAKIGEHANWIRQQRDKKNYTLNLEEYNNNKKLQKEATDKYNEILKNPTALNLLSLDTDLAHINEDSTRIVRRNKWIKDLSKDIYIEEAYNVTRELK